MLFTKTVVAIKLMIFKELIVRIENFYI